MTLDITYVQGEMAEWSDLGSPEHPAGGPVLDRVVEGLVGEGDRVLVVGVHDPALVESVLARARSVVLVLRSRVDALAAAETYAGRQVELVCGDVSGVRLSEPADVLLAFDGLDRAVSAESPLTPWRTRLDHLRAQLTPGGRVALTVPNPLGLAVLGGARGELRDDDAAWRSVVPPVHRPPAGPGELAEAAGASATWSLFPDLARPEVAVPVGTALAGTWAAALAQAYAGHRGARLDGPTTLAAAAAAGRVDELAAGWLVVSGTGAALLAPHATGAPVAGRVLEEVVLERVATREIGELRHLLQQVVATLGSTDDDTRAALAGLTADRVLLADDGTLVPLVETPGRTASVEVLVSGWCADLGVRLETLGWRHPWPTVSGAQEFARLLAAAAGLEPALAQAAVHPAPHDEAATRVEHLARLQAEIDALRAQVAWFERAVRQRDQQLATARHEQPDPRPELTRRLREAEAELAAVRGSSSFRLGRALTRPLRTVRSRLP